MKKKIFTAILISSLINLSFMPVKKIRVIFFGDSITEAAVKPNGFITIDDSLLNSGGNGNYELMG